ncbi:ATP-binding protein [Streptantibioticus silvisoli]|uniref:ATP-binding protein n=1 Tax=Streptantibioticus silvisoli TaxID=2705255 RepID=A0ABT6W4C3_9ACTN|nr:ATP-binding protein [Streptantibioticus silvisoli]MDI5965566.1 ATP-binding protein [Streptantibioticus silvisoli]
MTGRLYGRGRVVELVRTALRRQGIPDRPAPVVLLSGPRGSGGTALLDRIWTECGQDCLKVQVDLADAQGVEDAVLLAMAGLLERVPGIRPIRFPRLSLAVKALTYLDDGGGRSGFDAYMRGSRRYAAAQSRLDDWAGRVTPLLSGPEQQLLAVTAARTLGGVLDGLSRHQEKAVLAWFAQRRPAAGSGYDPLWDLRTARADPSPEAGRQVDKTLCAALLADLRADFNDARLLHGQRMSNPLLLFDNADSRAGRALLELVTETRREHHRGDGAADPAVLVAVRRGRLTGAVGRPLAATDERLSQPPARPAPPGTDHPVWWSPVRLTDLRPDDVAEMCRSSVLGSVRRDADFLHGLTGGHPAATADLVVLLELLGRDRFEAHDLLDTALPDPADLPRDWPEQDTGGMTVRDHLVRRVLSGFLADAPDTPTGPVVLRDHPVLSAMTVCAATPGLSEGAGRAALQYLRRTDDDAASVHERLTSALWLERDADGGGPGLHPLAALLLRQLAARDTPRQWERLHTGHMTHYAHTGDEPLRHLHQLALVENPQQRNLTAVTGYLDRCADDRPTRAWLTLLDQVTAAPNRLRTTMSREAVVTRLAGATAPGDRPRVVARLTVARWLFADRSFDPAHGLAKVIADEYDHLAGLTDGDSEPLYRESGRYRRVQREWEN